MWVCCKDLFSSPCYVETLRIGGTNPITYIVTRERYNKHTFTTEYMVLCDKFKVRKVTRYKYNIDNRETILGTFFKYCSDVKNDLPPSRLSSLH